MLSHSHSVTTLTNRPKTLQVLNSRNRDADVLLNPNLVGIYPSFISESQPTYIYKMLFPVL